MPEKKPRGRPPVLTPEERAARAAAKSARATATTAARRKRNKAAGLTVRGTVPVPATTETERKAAAVRRQQAYRARKKGGQVPVGDDG
jgi:hypothetical protein